MVHRKRKNLELSEDYLYYNTSFFPAFYVGFAAMSSEGQSAVIGEFIERTKKRVSMDGTMKVSRQKANVWQQT